MTISTVYAAILAKPEILRDQCIRAMDHHETLVEAAIAQGYEQPTAQPECIKAEELALDLCRRVDGWNKFRCQ